jgi:S-adenosylmethionine decarboxylase
MHTPGPEPFASPMPDLAPMIHRQRLVVEGTVTAPIGDETIRGCLRDLGEVIDMTVLAEPVTHRSPQYGWAGWVHWETSGAHFYAWDQPLLFFSVDIYSCKPFDPLDVVRFMQAYLDTAQVVARSI